MNKEALLQRKSELQKQLLDLTKTQSNKKEKYKFYYDYKLPIHTILGGVVGFGITHFLTKNILLKIGGAVACGLVANIITSTQQTKEANEKNTKYNALNQQLAEINQQLKTIK